MLQNLASWPQRTLFRVETRKRTMPFWLLLILVVALEACKKKY